MLPPVLPLVSGGRKTRHAITGKPPDCLQLTFTFTPKLDYFRWDVCIGVVNCSIIYGIPLHESIAVVNTRFARLPQATGKQRHCQKRFRGAIFGFPIELC